MCSREFFSLVLSLSAEEREMNMKNKRKEEQKEKKGLHHCSPKTSAKKLIKYERKTNYFLFKARSIATAIATVAPTIGLLPIPKNPIIST